MIENKNKREIALTKYKQHIYLNLIRVDIWVTPVTKLQKAELSGRSGKGKRLGQVLEEGLKVSGFLTTLLPSSQSDAHRASHCIMAAEEIRQVALETDLSACNSRSAICCLGEPEKLP